MKQFSIGLPSSFATVSGSMGGVDDNLFGDLTEEIGSRISQKLHEKTEKEYA